MRMLDEHYLKTPCYGVDKMTQWLRRQGHRVNPKRVRRLLRQMGLEAIYPRPRRNLSLPDKGHKIYPYLLRGVVITRPHQVWSTDITYIRLNGAFVYLTAIIDIYSRKVLSWRLSNTMDNSFCIDVLNEAICKYGKPEIFNTDHNSQFTDVLKSSVKINKDGKSRWMDNVFIERLWRSLKYEEVCVKADDTATEAGKGIGEWIQFYNHERTHQ